MVPNQKYQYSHPEGTGHVDSPFDSFWYMHSPSDGQRLSSKLTLSQGCVCVTSVDELRRGEYVPALKRLNPRQRKAAAKKRSMFVAAAL
mmetsp:Transcript_32244/g.43624  ORF Transcript_32244/g.43624 Transcript_32244/m.43624 type:complete len:89 (-) Transcript_32244:162-428(-)